MKFTTKLELTTKCSHSPRLLAHQAEQQSFKGCRHPRDMFSSLGSGARADSPSKGIRDNSSCRDFLSGFPGLKALLTTGLRPCWTMEYFNEILTKSVPAVLPFSEDSFPRTHQILRAVSLERSFTVSDEMVAAVFPQGSGSERGLQ